MIPKDEQAEYDLLAILIAYPNTISIVGRVLKPEAFYGPEHRNVYQAMINLYHKHVAVDLVSVSHELESMGALNAVGGRLYLADMLRASSGSVNLEWLVGAVLSKYRFRRMSQAGQLMQAKASTSEDPDQLIQEIQQILLDLSRSTDRNKPNSVGHFCSSLITKMAVQAESGEPLPGVKTGFYALDEITKGLQKGDVIVLAARPQMGKTTLALNICLDLAKRGEPVLMLSMEMSGEKLSRRLLAAHSCIPLEKLQLPHLLSQDEWALVSKAHAELDEMPLEIIESANITALDMLTGVREVKMKHGKLSLLAIDYLQLMDRPKSKNPNSNEEVSGLSRAVKACAMAEEIPVLELSQLNRAVEMRQNKRPMLSDLRDSGSIEQDADMVMFIYRDEVYNPESEHRGEAEIIIAKNRDGVTGTIDLLFQGSTNRFLNKAMSRA